MKPPPATNDFKYEWDKSFLLCQLDQNASAITAQANTNTSKIA
jgi:hypothetical protein